MRKLACLWMFSRKSRDKIVADNETDLKQELTMKISPLTKPPVDPSDPQTPTNLSTAMTSTKNSAVFNHDKFTNGYGDTCVCETLTGNSSQRISQKNESEEVDDKRSRYQAHSYALGDFEYKQGAEMESPVKVACLVEDKSSKLTSTLTDRHLSSLKSSDDDHVVDNESPIYCCGSKQSLFCEDYDGVKETLGKIHSRSGHLSDPGLYFLNDLQSTTNSPVMEYVFSTSRLDNEGEHAKNDLINMHILNLDSYQVADLLTTPIEHLSEKHSVNSSPDGTQVQKYDNFELMYAAKDHRQALTFPGFEGCSKWIPGTCHLQRESFLLPANVKDARDMQNEMSACASHVEKAGIFLQRVPSCTEVFSWNKVEIFDEQTQVSLADLNESNVHCAPNRHDFTNMGSCTTDMLTMKGKIKPSGYPGFNRVEEWVNNVDPVSVPHDEEAGVVRRGCDSLNFEIQNGFAERDERAVSDATSHADTNLMADLDAANTAARSVTPLATIAHLSGFGLRVVPMLGAFTSLKTLNLSANAIGRIFPGSLPKGLHSLNLSRNKITTIENLRELSRLRILNLSYNRISRIGQGLATCTSLRELSLASNKIRDIEGLHRLTKLCYLDLSLNKLATTKSLGQLSANYSCLQALDLTGNAVHTNLGDDQLRKFVCGLVPAIIYLNKQTLKAAFAKELTVGNNIGRMVLGNANNQRTGKPGSKAKKTITPKTDKQHQKSRTGSVAKHSDECSSNFFGPLINKEETSLEEKSYQQHLQHP